MTIQTAGECFTCHYLHTGAEPCWFDCCQDCGGEFTMGPSVSPRCGVCAQAEEDDEAGQ